MDTGNITSSTKDLDLNDDKALLQDIEEDDAFLINVPSLTMEECKRVTEQTIKNRKEMKIKLCMAERERDDTREIYKRLLEDYGRLNLKLLEVQNKIEEYRKDIHKQL